MPRLQVYDPLTGELLTADSVTAAQGAVTDPYQVDVYNDKDGEGATAARAPRLLILARIVGEDVFEADGLPVLDRRIIRGRVVSGLGGLEEDEGPTQQLGAGRSLTLPPLASTEGVRVELWYELPGSLDLGDYEVRFEVIDAGVETLGDPAITPAGLPLGLGDHRYSRLLYYDGAAPGTGATDLDVGAGGGILDGEPVAWDAYTETVDDTAADGALAAGESYIARLEVTSSGPGIVKGDGATTPTAPGATLGALQLALVTKTEGTALAGGDVDDVHGLGRWGARWATGSLTLGADTAVVDGALMRQSGEQVLPLAEGSWWWWLPPSGIAEATETAVPDTLGALPLYSADVDGAGDASNIVDLRPLLAAELVLRLPGVLAVGAADVLVLPGRLACLVDPGSVELHVGAIDPTAASGSVDVDLERLVAGVWTAWASLSIAFDAAELRVTAFPTDLHLGGGELLRATVTAVPDQPAEDAVVRLRVRGV
jgi:hypothetical protein